MRGALVLFLTAFLLRGIVAEFNSAVSGIHVWLFAGGLFLTYASLTATFAQGFAVAVLAGMACDAVTPVAFGTHATLFAIAHGFVHNARERVQRDETAVRVAVALVVNLALFAALSLIRIRGEPGIAAGWPRLLSDLLLSEGAVALVGPWFFSLQARSLQLCGAAGDR